MKLPGIIVAESSIYLYKIESSYGKQFLIEWLYTIYGHRKDIVLLYFLVRFYKKNILT